jgi:hypothetical protein
MLARTNLTTAATWRVRLGDAAALVEASATINHDFRTEQIIGTFTRASVAWGFNAAGVLVQFASNVPRFHYVNGQPVGLLVEPSRTNSCLWSRDFTQSAWVKTNLTAELIVTGIDGVASTASRLTATAANATALQTITLANGTRNFRIWLRRAVGTGAVQITINGGADWQAVTLTSAWQPFDVSATVTNPSVGVRIAVSGDVVDADVAQLEGSTPATSPIITTSATVTRTPDSLQVILASAPVQSGMLAVDVQSVLSFSEGTLSVRNGAHTNYVALTVLSNGRRRGQVGQSGVVVSAIPDSDVIPPATPTRVVATFGTTSAVWMENTLLGSYTHSGPLAPMDRVVISTVRGSLVFRRFALFPTPLTSAQAQAFSASWSSVTGAIYDSGTISGIVRGQAVHVLPSATTAAACRIDVSDPTNPDGFLNIPLIYAGPAWSMATNISRESAQMMADGSRRAETRGGQHQIEAGWVRRGWEIRLENHHASDAEQRALDLEAAARRGTNILCIPRPLTNGTRDAVFGLAEAFTPLRFSAASGQLRSIGFIVSERL